MSRGPVVIDLTKVVGGAGTPDEPDGTTSAVLDAAESLIRAVGLRRWSMEQVAEAAEVSRTSVYRRFPNRDLLVEAVLARELATVLGEARQAAAAEHTTEDAVAAAVVVCVDNLRGSLVDDLLTTDPATILPLLTTRAGPLLELARVALSGVARELEPRMDERESSELAELVARLGLSFVLTRDTVLALDDRDGAIATVRGIIGLLLGGPR